MLTEFQLPSEALQEYLAWLPALALWLPETKRSYSNITTISRLPGVEEKGLDTLGIEGSKFRVKERR